MSAVTKSMCERTFDESLRDAENWTYRSTVGFDAGVTSMRLRKAYRLGDVRDVFVERDQFESSLLSIYRSVKVGTVSRVVAGTGVGKSTKMPVSLVMSLECIAFVVCPTHAMAGSLASYVREFIVGTKYEPCTVSLIKTHSSFSRLVKPAVAYMGASEFLAMLSMHQQLFEERSVGFVYLDESHERIPAYAVCRLLVSLNFFKDTKVFMGSATASSQNMESRSDDVKQVVKSVKPELMQYDNVGNLSSKSPLHHTCLSLRTLIFVPTEKQFPMLFDYYESNAVHVRMLNHSARYVEIAELNEFLESVKYTVVVLATPAHQTGYTFAIDSVIDCGVTPFLFINSNNGDVEKGDRAVTEFERIQRAGRVGRFIDGVAYQVDADTTDEGFELYSGSEIYVVLWCKVFSIDVSIAYLRDWSVMLKDLTVTCAKNLLCSRLHPAIMLHYMDNDGAVYTGTKSLFGKLLGKTEAVVSNNKRLADSVLNDWIPKVMTTDVIKELVGEYRTPCQVPVDWLPIMCVMYNALNGVSMNTLFGDGKLQRRDLSGVSDMSSAVSYSMSGSSVGSNNSGGFIDPRVAAVRNNYRRGGDVTPDDSISVAFAPSKPKSRDRSVSVGSQSNSRPLSVNSNSGNKDLKRLSNSDSVKSGSTSSGKTRQVYVVPRSDDGGSRRHSAANSTGSRGSYSGTKTSSSTIKVDRDQVRGVVASALDKELRKLSVSYPQVVVGQSGSQSLEPPPVYTPRVVSTVDKTIIKAEKLVNERIRPYKDSHMDRYANLRVNQGYIQMYERLVERSVTIGHMAKEPMIDYYLSTVVSWNVIVSELYHFRAAPHTGLLSDMRNRSTFDKFDARLATCRGLLQVFNYHGFKLVLYRGSEQSGIVASSDDLTRALQLADYAQSVGNDYAVDAIERVKYCVKLSNEFGGVSGHYYVDGKFMLLVKHVFDEVDGEGTYMIFPRTDIASMRKLSDDRVFKCKLSVNAMSKLTYRLPVIGETVVVVAYLQRDVPDVFGVYTIAVTGASGVYDAQLSDGMSGAPIVALSDGCVIGLHHGKFVDGEYSGFSEYVTVV